MRLKQLISVAVMFGIVLAEVMGCDYAKPTDIDKLEEEISRLQADVDSLSSKSEEFESRLTAVDNFQARIDSLNERSDRLQAGLDNFGGRTNRLEGAVDSLRTSLEDLKSTPDGGDGELSPEQTRARLLLGFWRFDYTIITDWSNEYHLQRITDITTDEGELFASGISKEGYEVFAAYNEDLESYLLLDIEAPLLNRAVVFKIQGERATGEMLVYFKDQSAGDALSYTLHASSGRISGFSSPKMAPIEEKEKLILQELQASR